MLKIIFSKSWPQNLKPIRRKGFNAPSQKIINSHIRKLEKEWEKGGRRIIKEISKITNLKWQEKKVICYTTFGIRAQSNPLILNLRSDVDTLTHELIHRILSEPDNWDKIRNNWMSLMKKYQGETQITKIHIVIHAIHAAALNNLFGKKRFNEVKARVTDSNYIRSWKIVEKEGYKDIIKKFHGK